MTRADEYRVHAHYCANAAKFMKSDNAKRAFERQSRGWLRMAEYAENEERNTKAKRKRKRGIGSARGEN